MSAADSGSSQRRLITACVRLFERSVVQVGVGPRRKHLQRQWRGLGEIASDYADAPTFHAAQDVLESIDIHRVFETVPNRLAHQRVIGDLDFARQVLGAGHLIRKH